MQALCVATLGSQSDALRKENLKSEHGDEGDRFYLHYFFPPSSVGECGRSGPPGRRELGHGELAQRALAPMVPPASQFPYTVRLESTITESNGSSSMASVCGGCLAMLDAGVPLERSVAGIAMGLILEPDGRFSVLSDILGSEDALGDMDFKAGHGRAVCQGNVYTHTWACICVFGARAAICKVSRMALGTLLSLCCTGVTVHVEVLNLRAVSRAMWDRGKPTHTRLSTMHLVHDHGTHNTVLRRFWRGI